MDFRMIGFILCVDYQVTAIMKLLGTAVDSSQEIYFNR